jgi:restriction system protein
MSFKLSGYEWDLLEDRGYILGASQRRWYEIFLASNDQENLARLCEFYQPDPNSSVLLAQDEVTAPLSGSFRLIADARLIQFVAQDPTKILSLTSREFETLMAELLERLGYKQIVLGKGSKDGGVDVSAFIEHALGVERIIVQCKRNAPSNKVGEPTVKQLYTDVEIQKAARGLLITTSCLTRPARLLVSTYKHRLSAIEHGELISLLRGDRLDPA